MQYEEKSRRIWGKFDFSSIYGVNTHWNIGRKNLNCAHYYRSFLRKFFCPPRSKYVPPIARIISSIFLLSRPILLKINYIGRLSFQKVNNFIKSALFYNCNLRISTFLDFFTLYCSYIGTFPSVEKFKICKNAVIL